jgi:peptide/nickel transport system permease protein
MSDRVAARRERDPSRTVAVAVLVAVVAVALGADLLAADRPILLRDDGELFVGLNFQEGEPRGDRLRAQLGPDDWAIFPPIAHDPVEVRTGGELAPLTAPSSWHLLGTDDRGRDVAARLIHGTRTTARIAGGATVLALLVAAFLALLAVTVGGVVGRSVLIACDAIAAAPPILTVIAAQGLIGAHGVLPIIVLIAVPRAADTARLAAAGMRRALAEPFVEAARATGASRLRILVRHALPQTAPALVAASALTAATAVLSESALAFLGAGVPTPTPTWGELLAQATAHDLRGWLAWPAGLAITATTWALLTLSRAGSYARPTG